MDVFYGFCFEQKEQMAYIRHYGIGGMCFSGFTLNLIISENILQSSSIFG